MSFATSLEKAHMLRWRGRFAKRPSLVKEIEQLTPDQLREIWKSINANAQQSAGIKFPANPHPEAVRGFLMQACGA
jgi:hypothetical protein